MNRKVLGEIKSYLAMMESLHLNSLNAPTMNKGMANGKELSKPN